MYCAMCHGALGTGDGPLAEELKRQGQRPAALNDRARLERLGRARLTHVIRKGGAHTGRSNLMPPWGRTFDRALTGEIAGFVLALSDTQRGSTAEVIRKFLASPPGVTGRGRELFVFYCAICHGESGKGDGRLADTLSARNWIRPRDLSDSAYFAHLKDQHIFASVTYMPAWDYALPAEQIRGLLSYVRAISHTNPRP
jgi:cytochrome c oxidase cbb3-type subunit 3